MNQQTEEEWIPPAVLDEKEWARAVRTVATIMEDAARGSEDARAQCADWRFRLIVHLLCKATLQTGTP